MIGCFTLRPAFAFLFVGAICPVGFSAATPDAGTAITMEKLVVTAKPEAQLNTIDRKIYNVGQDLQSSAGSAGDLLQNIPSVQVDVDGNVSLRGNDNVLILIDGKPSTLMSARNRADALAQMPADTIERIEVITNPSPKYKPDGTAGIINIVVKHRYAPGFSGAVRTSAGNDHRANSGLTANYQRGKLNVFVSYTFGQPARKQKDDTFKPDDSL